MSHFYDTELSSTEIVKLIKRLKNKMLSGYDQTANHMIKLFFSAHVQCLMKSFNTWLQTSKSISPE